MKPDGAHSAPDYGCRCGRAHCATCGEVWPCRRARQPQVGATEPVLQPLADLLDDRFDVSDR